MALGNSHQAVSSTTSTTIVLAIPISPFQKKSPPQLTRVSSWEWVGKIHQQRVNYQPVLVRTIRKLGIELVIFSPFLPCKSGQKELENY